MATFLLALGLTTLPGLYAFVSGNSLVRRLDDPSLNDLYFGRSRRLTFVTILSLVLLAVFTAEWAVGTMPMAILGSVVGAFPARRRLFEETWGLGGYLSHTLKLTAGMYGPWLLLAVGPLVLLTTDASPVLVAVLYVAALAGWGIWGGAILVWMLGAAPLGRADLSESFAPMLAAATCATPQLLVTRPDGGSWANAFAVPQPKKPAVLFTDGLLELLTLDEATAILAHELAHLEEFQGGRWVRRALIPAVLGASVVIAFLLADVLGPWIAWSVPGALIVALILAGGAGQKRETESDVRAVELTGDPEALVRALEKIHERARMPRRVDSGMERRLTHPSLARRTQAIRAAGGSEGPTALDGGERALGADPLRIVVAGQNETVLYLAHDRLYVFEGVADRESRSLEELSQTASARSYPYGTLRELRVAVQGSKRFLVLWPVSVPKAERFALDPTDVPQVQSWLDLVDGELATDSARRSGRYAKLARGFALVGALLSVLTASYGFLIACIGAALVGRRPVLWAAGIAGVLTAGGGMAGLRSSWLPDGEVALLLPLAAVVAVALLVLAELEGREDPARGGNEDPVTAVVAGLGLIALALITLRLASVPSSSLVMGIHLWARSVPDALVMMTGCGAGLLLLNRPLAKVGGVLVLTLCSLLGVLGLPMTRAVSGDLLREAPGALEVGDASITLVRTVDLDGGSTRIWIDPVTGHLLVESLPEDGRAFPRFRVETGSGWRALDADQVAWTSSGAVVLLRAREGVVRLEDRSGDAVVEYELGPTTQPTLAVRGDRWVVLDQNVDEGTLRIHSPRTSVDPLGGIRVRSGAALTTHTLSLPAETPATSIAVTEDAVVFATVKSRPSLIPLPMLGGWPIAYGVGFAHDDETDARSLSGETALDLTCMAGSSVSAYCVSHAGSRTEIWAVSPESGSLEPIGQLRGWYWGEEASEGIVLDDYAGSPIWVGGDPVRPVRLPLDGYSTDGVVPERWRQALDVAGAWLGVLWTGEGGSVVELYRMQTVGSAAPLGR